MMVKVVRYLPKSEGSSSQVFIVIDRKTFIHEYLFLIKLQAYSLKNDPGKGVSL